MTENYLVRILTDELTSFTDLPFWQIQAKVCDAVHRAMRQTDGLDEFINALQNRIVRFSYKKTDGSVREAIGTMKPSVLSTLSAKMQSGQKRRSTGCIVYFDLEREIGGASVPKISYQFFKSYRGAKTPPLFKILFYAKLGNK